MAIANSLDVQLAGATGTGQFVGDTSPTLITPNIGVANGTSLAVTTSLSVNGNDVITTINRVIFTASDTYTAPANLAYVEVQVIGGGGGSGATPATGGSQSSQSGGGGGGAYGSSIIDAATVGASQTISVGAGGTGGLAGANPGNAGGASSFGALVTANAGQGGAAAVPTGSGARVSGSGGIGGTPGTGQLTISGEDGIPGIKTSNSGEFQTSVGGGTAIYHPNAVGSVTSTTGQAGSPGTGQGASGLSTSTSQIAGAGVSGGSGIIIITEFLSS